jgi:hypothetical protein
MIRRFLINVFIKILGGKNMNILKLWSVLIVSGSLKLNDVPVLSRTSVHNELVGMGFNDDGTATVLTPVKPAV